MNYTMKFQYYPARVKSNTPLGYVSLEYFLKSQKSPKEKTQGTFNAIALAEKLGNQKAKAELKQNNLYYFTPCVNVDGFRRYSNVLRFTGLAVLDFDHIDNANEFKEFLFNEYKFLIAAWLSPSKRGVKALVNIPVSKNIDEFKEYYYALSTIFDVYDGWDGSNKNAVLPLFQSWDSDLLQRENPELFSQRLVDPNSLQTDNVKVAIPENVQGKERLIFAIADTGISKISAPGHPQLRSVCIALGGYIASGYIEKFILLRHVDSLIESNGYLRKGTAGYKKTARWAIDEGMKIPIRI